MRRVKNKISYMLAFIAGIGSILDISGRTFHYTKFPKYSCQLRSDRDNLMLDWAYVARDMHVAYHKLVSDKTYQPHGEKELTEEAA